jgi:hypothetical protein
VETVIYVHARYAPSSVLSLRAVVAGVAAGDTPPYTELSFVIQDIGYRGYFQACAVAGSQEFYSREFLARRTKNTKPAKGFGGSRGAMESHSQNRFSMVLY